MDFWTIAGSLLLIWVAYDLVAGSVWIHRKVERQYEASLYWVSIICYTALGVSCFIPYN